MQILVDGYIEPISITYKNGVSSTITFQQAAISVPDSPTVVYSEEKTVKDFLMEAFTEQVSEVALSGRSEIAKLQKHQTPFTDAALRSMIISAIVQASAGMSSSDNAVFDTISLGHRAAICLARLVSEELAVGSKKPAMAASVTLTDHRVNVKEQKLLA